MPKPAPKQLGEKVTQFLEVFYATQDPVLTAKKLQISIGSLYSWKQYYLQLSERELQEKLRKRCVQLTPEQIERIRKAKKDSRGLKKVIGVKNRQLLREQRMKEYKINHVITTQTIVDIINEKLRGSPELAPNPINRRNLADLLEQIPYFGHIIEYNSARKEYSAQALVLRERLDSIGAKGLASTVKKHILKEKYEPAQKTTSLRKYHAEIKTELPPVIKKAIQTLDLLVSSEKSSNPEKIAAFKHEWNQLYARWEPYLHGTSQEALLEETNQKVRTLGKKKINIREKIATYNKTSSS